MREKLSKDQLLFYHEIERTTQKLNSKTRKRKQLAKQRNQREGNSNYTYSITPLIEEVMGEPIVIRRSCVNNPRRNAHIVRPTQNARNSEMKTGLLQILYGNPFTGLVHENPYTHLIKFYEISGMLRAPEAEE